jgi:arginine exporter protein ArgO
MMLGAVAAGKYLAPRVGGELGHWTPLAAAAAVLLIAVIPLSCLWQRSKYMETLITWVGSLVAAVIAVFLATAVFDAVAAGKKETSKAGKHNREIKELLGR